MSIRFIAAVSISVLIAGVAPAAAQMSASEALRLSAQQLRNYGIGPTDALFADISLQSLTFPVATSANGFTFEFDRGQGLPKRTTRQFGPLFAERAVTSGAGHVTLAVHQQYIRWAAIDGAPLDQLITLCDGCEHKLVMNYSNMMIVPTVNIGVSDRLDAAVAVPFVRARVNTTVSTSHYDGTSSGLGDIVARLKYRLWTNRTASFAGIGQVRFPTGNADDLLGTGKAALGGWFLASFERGRVSPHGGIGFMRAGRGIHFVPSQDPRCLADPPCTDKIVVAEPSNELDYTFGADVEAHQRLTISGEFIGRYLFNYATVPHFGPGFGGSFSELYELHDPVPGPVRLGVVVAGAKLRVIGQSLLTMHVVCPVTDAGLKPHLTLVVGIEVTR